MRASRSPSLAAIYLCSCSDCPRRRAARDMTKPQPSATARHHLLQRRHLHGRGIQRTIKPADCAGHGHRRRQSAGRRQQRRRSRAWPDPKPACAISNTAETSIFIFPGFNDAHVHLGGAGQTKLNVDLTGVKSLAEMLAQGQSLRRRRSPPAIGSPAATGTTLSGPAKSLPTRQDLDKVTAGHPAFLSIASTATSPSPTPLRSRPPASPAKPRRRKAAPSTSTPTANPPAFCANPRRSWSTKSFRHPHRRAPPRRRARHRRRALPRRHQRAGLQRLAGLSRLRGDGKGRQAQSAHQRVASLQGFARP